MDERVSIIIPCFNAEKTINRAINSVYIQNYPNIELIVVDDGSKDKSADIVMSWSDKFEQNLMILRYVYQKNQGLGGAINTGLKYVTGELLTLLDADDCFLDGSISIRAQFLANHSEFVGVRSNGWMVKRNQKELFIINEDEKKITDLFKALVCGKTNNWAGSYMVRTQVLFDFYPDREIYTSRFGQNLQIILPVAYRNKFGYIDIPLMEYKIQTESLSQSSRNSYNKEEENADGYQDIYSHMINAIVNDPKEHDLYMNISYACYYRSGMLRAIKYKNMVKMNEYYKKLVKTGLQTLDDKIAFYSIKCWPLSVIFRCLRKILYFIKGEKIYNGEIKTIYSQKNI